MNKPSPLELLQRIYDFMAEDDMEMSDDEAGEELLAVYGSQEAVDAAIKGIKDHAERCIEEARKKLKDNA